VRALPDVQDIATSYSLPLDKDGAYFRPAIITARNRVAADHEIVASYHIVSPRYFRVLRMSITQGRDFAETDGLQSLPVAIANESLTRRIFPDEHAVGQQIACCEEGKARTIVGVVKDLKSEGLESPAGPEIYVPFAQDSQVSTRLPDHEPRGIRSASFPRCAAPLPRWIPSGHSTTSARWKRSTTQRSAQGALT